MSHFVTDETDRIELDEKYWVDIKRKMSYGDQQRLVASFMRLQNQVKKDPEVEIDLQMGNITLMLINIKKWNLDDADGKIVSINEKNINSLSIDTAEKILDEINERNPSPKV